MIYQGIVLVPVRVISEGMGAYVLWVPDQPLVVVRYIPPTPPPTPAPPPPPPPPPPTPTPTPIAKHRTTTSTSPVTTSSRRRSMTNSVRERSSNNNNGGFSYRLHGAIEIPVMALPFMVEVDYRQYNWQHQCGGADCYVTTIGGLGQSFVPQFIGRDYDFDARLGIRILKPRIYIVGGYMSRTNNSGYPSGNGRRRRDRETPRSRPRLLVLRQRRVLLRRQRQLRRARPLPAVTPAARRARITSATTS